MDRQRLRLEVAEMRRIPRLRNFGLFEETDVSPDSWHRYLWKGTAPSGHQLTARYPKAYPRQQLCVTVEPKIKTHHYLNGGLCIMKSHQWSPNYTAATNILIAFRFLEEVRRGIVRD